MFYLKSNLTGNVTRAVANVVATVYILAVIAVIVLQFTNVSDLYATSPIMYLLAAAGTLVITALLFVETRHNSRAVMILISWTPLTLSILLDALNRYLVFTNIHFYYFGLTITMIYQIVRLVYDLRKQYLESIRYQQMQKELYEAKVGVMVSQIQPHFMYNALTSIAMMCSIDPETAQEATVTFAKYLRGNMDSLKQTNPVPFTQELEHLKKYLYIEKLRFGNKLNIEYDIQATDFVLPQLSIQPIVENAVKHGVGMKKKGGTVTIATRETDNAYEVIVSDDGVGFDTTAQKKDDGRSHVGMENTQRRLKDMCGGEMKIESTPGEGTVATVILPKEGQKNEDTVS
jgi:sensor histidine kinase YesM